MPKIPPRFILLIAALALLVAAIQIGVLTVAFEKLDLSADSAYLLFVTILGGSLINLPLFSMKSEPPNLEELPPQLRELYRRMPYTGKTLIMANVRRPAELQGQPQGTRHRHGHADIARPFAGSAAFRRA